MKRRIVSGVLCGLLSMATGCGQPALKPNQLQSCVTVDSRVLNKDGTHYLHVRLPDKMVVIVNLDALPKDPPTTGSATAASSPTASALASGGGSGDVEGPCPCQEPICISMCGVIQGMVGPGANLCPAPPPTH